MKVCYIDLKKKTSKMSVTMKEFKAYEASDNFVSENQVKFISVDCLAQILKDRISVGLMSDESYEKIMEDIENISESR